MFRNQPAPSVQYSTFMPSIESLVQEWPLEVYFDQINVTIFNLQEKNYAMFFITESFNMNMLHQFFYYKITFVNSQHN